MAVIFPILMAEPKIDLNILNGWDTIFPKPSLDIVWLVISLQNAFLCYLIKSSTQVIATLVIYIVKIVVLERSFPARIQGCFYLLCSTNILQWEHCVQCDFTFLFVFFFNLNWCQLSNVTIYKHTSHWPMPNHFILTHNRFLFLLSLWFTDLFPYQN